MTNNKEYNYNLLRIGDIAFGHYSSGKTDTVLVYGLGAPTVPDNGCLEEAEILTKNGIDVVVPDYIGYGRSSGVFTPKNCIKTFLNLKDYLVKGTAAKNFYLNKKTHLKYKKLVFLGRSLGGAYVPLLPKYDKSITELFLLFPALDQKAQGEIKGEETNEQFLESMEKDGYHYLYRGVLRKVWRIHLENEDGLSPMDNVQCLKNSKVFIAHGKKDKCIHYSKSVKFYKKLKETHPKKHKNYMFKLYPEGRHGSATSIPAVKDFVKWREGRT